MVNQALHHILSSNHYRQGRGVISLIGDEAAARGKHALLLGDTGGLNACEESVLKGLRTRHMAYTTVVFQTECSFQERGKLEQVCAENGCDLIIGLGGGKCMDLAKAAAEIMELPIITVPSIAATCAACTPLSIMYQPSGRTDRSLPLNRGVDVCLADTDILLKAPPGTLASGIADSLAKHQEIMCGSASLACAQTDAGRYGAYRIALAIDHILYEKAIEAYESCRTQIWSREFEDVVYTILSLTALCSGLVSGAGQLALAHSFNDAVHDQYPAAARDHLHGEIVGVGTVLQMAVNESTQLEQYQNLLRELHLAVSVDQLGIPAETDTMRQIEEYLSGRMGANREVLAPQVHRGLKTLFRLQ